MTRRVALSEFQVAEARVLKATMTFKQLASFYEVSLMTIWKAVNKQKPYDYETTTPLLDDNPVSDNGRTESV